jgi:hypothetical protein
MQPGEKTESGVEILPLNPYDVFCRSNWCERIKLVLASVAVFLLVLVIFVGIAFQYNVLKINPAANYVIMFGCLLLLAYLESLHYAVVAVEKWDMNLYADRFPRAVKCHKWVNTPEKVKKFLVGRQFFVIFVVFLLAQTTTFAGKQTRNKLSLGSNGLVCLDIPHDFAGMPAILVLILVQTGLPGVALTLTFGQLVSHLSILSFSSCFMMFSIILLCVGESNLRGRIYVTIPQFVRL